MTAVHHVDILSILSVVFAPEYVPYTPSIKGKTVYTSLFCLSLLGIVGVSGCQPSQLTPEELIDPTWWHWVTLVVPDTVRSSTGLLYIGSGDRTTSPPTDASELAKTVALSTQSIVTEVHNIPNQPIEFIGDDFGVRNEDDQGMR